MGGGGGAGTAAAAGAGKVGGAGVGLHETWARSLGEDPPLERMGVGEDEIASRVGRFMSLLTGVLLRTVQSTTA